MGHMSGAKLVKLGFSREYEFLGISLSCEDHRDLYSESDYETNGCFGCERLTFTSSIRLSCTKGHTVKRLHLRKDENNKITEVCTNRTYGSWGSKSSLNCNDCLRHYESMGTVKCRLKYNVKEEIVRVGFRDKT